MKKKITILGCMVLVALATVIMGYGMYQNSPTQSLLDANVEALSKNEGGLDTSYIREEKQCRIYVGAKGQLRLLGGNILKAGVDGYVIFDGHVICGGGGNYACTPIECKDLYTEIFNR